jgi:ribosome-binding protein aMBF1 (putative translation factor)
MFAIYRDYGVMLIERSIDRVRAFRKAMGWSIHRFATEASVADSTIRPMDANDWSPTADTLKKLEAVIPPDFFPPSPVKTSEAA